MKAGLRNKTAAKRLKMAIFKLLVLSYIFLFANETRIELMRLFFLSLCSGQMNVYERNINYLTLCKGVSFRGLKL